MVIFSGLADRLAVRTPVMDAIIKITSVVPGRDLRGKGAHTMKTLGLHELSIEQLRICDPADYPRKWSMTTQNLAADSYGL